MKVASLFSGGKDSTYAVYKAKNQGHDITCLISISPVSEESHLLHYPNIDLTSLQAKTMNIPQLLSHASNVESEKSQLHSLLEKAIKDFGIEGVVHGGLFSDYQRKHFEKLGNDLSLEVISPLWHVDQKNYLKELLAHNFKFIIVSVSSAGLDDSWLGKEITCNDISTLEKLSSKYGFNLTFEGGEAETFVIDCPLFKSPIKILRANKTWDGYRGRFEITEAVLENIC